MQQRAFFSCFGNLVLLASLLAAGVFTALIGFVDYDTSVLAGNLAYVPINVAWVAVAFFAFARLRRTPSARFLLAFFVTAVLWFVAEMAWTVLELVYEEDPFPSVADLFYIAGYASMFAAFGAVLFPHLKKIPFDIKLVAASLSVLLLVPLVLVTYNEQYDDFAPAAISYAYPVLDVVLLWYCIVAAFLFSKRTDFVYYLIGGIMMLIIADTEFAVSSVSGTYVVGQLSEVFFYWSYMLLAFAAYRAYRSPLQDASDVQLRHVALSGKVRFALLALTFLLLVVILVSSVVHFGFGIFSPNEEKVLIPLLYSSSSAVFLTMLIHAAFHKKRLPWCTGWNAPGRSSSPQTRCCCSSRSSALR